MLEINSIVHQISSGSKMLSERQFIEVFKAVDKRMASAEYEFLQRSFQKLMNTNRLVLFTRFLQHFEISSTPSAILGRLRAHLQKEGVSDPEELDYFK